MSFFRRLFSFSLIQLVIELIFLAIIGVLASFIVSMLNTSQLIGQTIGESILVVGVAATFLLARFWVERRPFAELGLSGRHLVRNLLLGFVLGLLLQGTTIGILALAGWYRITSIAPAPVAVTLILQGLGIHLLVALFEEGVFRGILFRLLERSLGSWIAIILSALFFGLGHLLNPGATLFGALAIALEAGILLGVAYMLTRSLWLAIGIHWAWNFFEGPFFGATISGVDPSGKTVITPTISGPALWTGGNFGPEAGVVALLACLVASAIFLILIVKRKQVIVPSWLRSRSSRAAAANR
ncbi:hypothetical protein EI42_04054 [Thermosporothrix hazakensis]|jgi:membrane protease YdiL (CAAX protease family)|uniref:CAAX prenyl protease 2/Lysostaphin resistance protein A-like domain-containing protein n=2 Tax=Thermosporothrix TaxID=768650 RepID=A0A326UC41_THEHA|nr:type II CAAX endopeptidase family protein [Thermosporothrix hazakensis]PZW26095.1 hypothetical protein EI42_04054 [Thermosporothrix hazakensis]BBH87069.1 membrane protein [Thermosporothrix sp. COM3]GCE51355.1 membrane protein [Thermosporothrix hazakensis]